MSRAPQRTLAACTIIARNHLAQARVLARSFAEAEPGGRFHALVVDGLPAGWDVGFGARVLGPADLGLPCLPEMCMKYSAVELCTALKPALLLKLFAEGEEDLAYFDSDVLVTGPLGPVKDALGRGRIVLTPHLLAPIPADGRRPSERDILLAGAYNLGFLAVRRSDEAGAFLGWWQERLRDGCRVDHARGLFADQKWIDLVPGLFPSTAILRDDTCNVAYWNLHARALEKRGDRFFVNGRPLTFFHFSGFDPDDPRALSRHQDRFPAQEGTALADLLALYADLLARNGHRETSRWPYGYSTFDNGVAVHPLFRRLYLDLAPESRAAFGDPFRSGAGSFFAWATAPRAETGLSPFLESLHGLRYDVAAAFPDPGGADREAFLSWARTQGAREMGYDPRAVRDSAAVAPAVAAPGSVPPRDLAARVRDVVEGTLPAGVTVLVVSRGDGELLDLDGRQAWHFPQTAGGEYAGYHPPDSATAVGHLEALRARGARYLLFPGAALWWLDHYGGLREHLERRYRQVVRDEGTCVIYDLSRAKSDD